MLHRFPIRLGAAVGLVVSIAPVTGCYSLINGWLTPTELGSFTRQSTLEIRGSLSIQDTPRGVRGATEPIAADLVPTVEQYRLVPGDVVNVFIFELRARGVESAQQSVVDNRGMINLPVIGWFKAAGLTAQELEDEIRDILADRDIIQDAEVLVQFAAQRALTYTIFGNELLAVRLNRGPGVFPIPRPDFALLDAMSVSGGLSELVSEVYVFRKVDRDRAQEAALLEASGQAAPDTSRQGQVNQIKPEPEEPPPLPGVNLTSGVGASIAALTGVSGASSALAVQEVEPPKQPPPPPPPPSDEPELEPEPPPDVQEIIDLMLGEPEQQTEPPAEEPPTETPPTEEPPAEPEQPREPPKPEDLEPSPPYIYLNGEWIEVKTDTPRMAEPPPAPGPEAPIEPVIDWEAIAQSQQEVRLIRISAEGLRQGDPRYNIVVRPGDVIRLYSGDIGFYYMTGHVRRPGVYSFRSGTNVTLKNAVAAAGGLDALGWPDRVTVYRRIGDREQMIQVNLDRIYAGADPDFYLKKDDIVNFGTHPFAPFLIQIRNLTIPQMGGSITYFYRYINQKTKFDTIDANAQTVQGLFP